MEFFGLTQYGVSSPIKDMLRPDYVEPDKPPKNLMEVEDKSGQKFSERIKELDCYIGFADGFSYRSYDRMDRMKKKHVIKPVGSFDMYRYPGTTSMEYGWWLSDPSLKDDEWFKPRKKRPLTTSEMSRFTDHCLKIDKYYRW